MGRYASRMTPSIRPMLPSDLDATVAAGLAGGWGDRRAWLEFALGHAECDPLVAVDGGEVVAMGVGTRNGPAGWVGTIFVVPERRREGIGLAISAAACERLQAAGCRTLLLVATTMGRPVYERLGFHEAGWYRAFEAPARDAPGGGDDHAAAMAGGDRAAASAGGSDAAASADENARGVIRPFGPADVPEAARLDSAATGEDRLRLLAAFAAIPGGLSLRAPDGELRGFVCRAPWGGGATVAVSIREAERLLAARRASAEPGHRVRAGVLGSNEAGVRRLTELGWTEVYRVVRMQRGDALAWRPERLWGQFNFAVG